LGAGAHTRHPVGLEGARTWPHRCAGDVQCCHHAHAFVHRLHIWVPPYSNSGSQRAIHTTDHRDDLLRDNVIRYTVGLFVFTFLFAIKALDRTETSVHQLVAFVVGLLGLICIVAFLFLIDYAARMLRPVSLVGRVGEYGLEAIKSVYPEQSTEAQSIAASQQNLGPPKRTILHRGKSAIVVA